MSQPPGADGADRLRAIARRAMAERDLWPDFSPTALQQAQTLSAASIATASASAVRPASSVGTTSAGAVPGSGGIRDLRQLLWASIDNDDSLDLDQLSVAQPLEGGAVKVLIAIADVAALVGRGTPIDQHAAHNTTSVYTAAQVFSMLPERLSSDLSVLREDAQRAALVIELEVDPSGQVGGSEIYPAIVVNQAKLAYDAVAAWLEGKGRPPPRVATVAGLAEQLRVQDRAAQALKRQRQTRGALTLQTLETQILFAAGVPSALRVERPNRAKTLIEEFMIAANAVAAAFLEHRSYPSMRRVLPPPVRWDRIVALAAGLQQRLPSAPDASALNDFLIARRIADPSGFPDLSLSVIKLLGRAQYALEIPGTQTAGHFGLAVDDYMHSTAPNRRFADLLTQRLLHAALAGAPTPYALAEIRQLAAQCTVQEDNAAKVERQVAKSAAAMLLSRRIGTQFEGIVTGASPKGTWVRVEAPPIEGRVVEGFIGLDVGDHAQIRLAHTDIERGFIDFVRVK